MVGTLRKVADTASDLGQDLKDSVEEFSRTAGKKMAAVQDKTGSALHAAAKSVRHSSAAIDNFATGAASRLDKTASFVEDCNVKTISNSVRRFGRKHLTGSLMAAIGVGFIAGVALSRAGRSRA